MKIELELTAEEADKLAEAVNNYRDEADDGSSPVLASVRDKAIAAIDKDR